MPDNSWESQTPDELPRLSKTKYLKRLKDRLDICKRYRESEGLDATWRRMVDMYRGKVFNEEDLSKGDCISVNLSFSAVNVIAPSIAINYPKIVVYPRIADPLDPTKADLAAAIAEKAVNYWWRHEDVKPEFQRAVKDSLIIGHGWLKVGYRRVEMDQPKEQDELAMEVEQLVQQADKFAAENPDQAGDLPTDEDIAQNIEPTKKVVVEDHPFVERVSAHDIFVDPEGTCMGDIKWIAQRIVRPLEEVKRDKKFSGAGRKELGSDMSVNRDWRDPRNDKRYDDDIKRVTIWEFYDIQRGKMCVFAETSKDHFLLDPMDMPYSYGQPFYMIRNYDVPDKFYPIGDLEQVESVQKELNETRSQMIRARKRDIRKYLYRRNALSGESISALKSDRDGEMVAIEDDSYPLGGENGTIVPVPVNAINPEMYRHSELIEADVEKISGVSDYMRGALPETTRTATEASIVQDAINARSADKLAKVEEAVRHIAAMLIQLAQTMTSTEQMIPIVGAEAGAYWLTFRPEDIEGEFLFEVEAGSTQPKNETFRRQQAIQMLNALQPYLMSGVVNIPELLKYVLQFGFDMKDPQKFIFAMPPMMPMAPEQQAGQNPNGSAPNKKPEDQKQNKDSKEGKAPGRPLEGMVNQLAGQVGLDVSRMGGGALGPGAG